jgi:hypothetical protein
MTGTKHVHVSGLSVERFLQGELKGEDLRRFDRETAACAECARLLAETRADDAAFALRPIPEYVRAAGEPAPARSFFRPWFVALPAAAALAALAIVFMRPAPRGQPDEIAALGHRGGDSVVRIKGDASASATPLSLGFYVSRAAGGGKTVGRSGEKLTRGDRIQFFYDAPKAAPFALVGIDGRDEVTIYFSTGDGGGALQEGRGLALEGAIELDDSAGAERFFLCAGEGAKDVEAVQQAAEVVASSGDDLSRVARLPLACDQSSVWIRKE